MGWIPRWGSLWMAFPSASAPHLVSVTPSMGIVFPLLRRIKVSTLWSSFFLRFMCYANCILDNLTFWTNIHLSVSAYHVCSYVIGLPHSGWYFQVPSIFYVFVCVCLFVCLFVFWDRVSLCSPGCPGTHFVDQAGFKLRNLPASASQVLGLKACTTTAQLLLYTFKEKKGPHV